MTTPEKRYQIQVLRLLDDRAPKALATVIGRMPPPKAQALARAFLEFYAKRHGSAEGLGTRVQQIEEH